MSSGHKKKSLKPVVVNFPYHEDFLEPLFRFDFPGLIKVSPSFSKKDGDLNSSTDKNNKKIFEQVLLPYFEEVESLIDEVRQEWSNISLIDLQISESMKTGIEIRASAFGSASYEPVKKNLELSKCLMSGMATDVGYEFVNYFGKPAKGVHAIQIIISKDFFALNPNVVLKIVEESYIFSHIFLT